MDVCIIVPMKRSHEIALMVLTNIVGFLSVSICFYVLLLLGIVDEEFWVSKSQISLQTWSASVIGVWLVCFLFSIAGFFIKQKEKIILLVAPAIIPMLYGFSVLILFGGV